MKSVGHAWLGLMALERLRAPNKGYIAQDYAGYNLGRTFNPYFRKQAEKFVKFFDKHKDAFVQGAWFPDSVISDNLAGGHTYKIKPPTNAKERGEAITIRNFTPSHLTSSNLIEEARFDEPVYIKHDYTLPDRCHALSEGIRDMIRIQRKVPKGSDILFNDDQITTYFLMLCHYVADAHVPPHCDARDFYTPSKIHPDMEKYWDDEIKKFFEFDKKRKVFDYDIGGAPELIEGAEFQGTLLDRVMNELGTRTWDPAKKSTLGKGNKKVYDYMKSICFVSYFLSKDFIPEMTQREYNALRVLEEPAYADNLTEISVPVLADAIDSIALVWLLTWDKYNKLDQRSKKKSKEIKKKGGKLSRR
ncbi:hypothetical protein ACFLYT_00235 [Nanoarchaeota archaeon]